MSEALRLAAWCETFNHNEMEATAAELRRLHALNAELVEALRGLEWAASHSEYLEYQYADQLGKARAALAKVEAGNGS